MIVTGIAVAIIGVLIAPIAIPALFGRRYDSAVHIFMLMSVCAPLRFLTISASSVLTARSLNWVRNGCATAALVISVLSGCILVPVWGLVGAAAASIVGEVVWAILSVGSARRSLRRVPNAHVRDMADQKSLATHEASGSGNCAPISVVIPCFNCRTTIERAVDSVFNQTLRPTEIVLVDDHSTDGTGAFIQSLAQTYPSGWIRVILLENNVGPGAARNFGWATVRQPYIAFLDSDDSWHPRKIEIQYGWMHNHPDAAITGHPVAELSGEKSVCSIPLGELLEPCRVSRARVLFSNRFTPSSIVMRTNCSARFDEMKRHAEDYFMLLEILLVDAGRCYLFSVPLSYVYKAQFGAKTGLSAQLWMIQKGEQDNYHRFWKRGLISDVEWMCFSALSAVKYVRRCLMSGRFV
jgi:glycosyltransferase involved in cell wall biosynthesis